MKLHYYGHVFPLSDKWICHVLNPEDSWLTQWGTQMEAEQELAKTLEIANSQTFLDHCKAIKSDPTHGLVLYIADYTEDNYHQFKPDTHWTLTCQRIVNQRAIDELDEDADYELITLSWVKFSEWLAINHKTNTPTTRSTFVSLPETVKLSRDSDDPIQELLQSEGEKPFTQERAHALALAVSPGDDFQTPISDFFGRHWTTASHGASD